MKRALRDRKKKPYETLLKGLRCLEFYLKPLFLSSLKTLHQLIGLHILFFGNKIHLPLSYQAAMKSVLISRRVTFEDNRSIYLICTRSVRILINSRNLKYP